MPRRSRKAARSRRAWPEPAPHGTHRANMQRAFAFALGFAVAVALALLLYPT
jgi:hypothetical protein